MGTKNRLAEALKEAMRNRDEITKRTLRMALSAIKLAEVDQGGELDESALLAVLQRQVKSRQETIRDAAKAGRSDLEAEAQSEIEILQQFLPQPLSAADLEDLARETIDQVGAASPSEMGKVMQALMPRVQGRADGAEVSRLVRRLLQGT
jgi:uncharacterized protein YqeY